MKIEIDLPDSLVESTVKGIMENFPEASATLACDRWKYDEFCFQFTDTETGVIFKLEKSDLLKAFPLVFTDKWPKGCTAPPVTTDPERWDAWLCLCDATDFDAFVQLACFGEVIYG